MLVSNKGTRAAFSARRLLNRKVIRGLVFTAIFFVLFVVVIKYAPEDIKTHEKSYTKTQGKSWPSDEAKRIKVIGMMRHAWDGYEKYAFGADHLLPISKNRHEWMGLGISVLDALDTSHIMGEMDIYNKCRDWIKNNFTINPVKYRISVFETNIRVVGGFLSTYALTNDKLFLEKAIYTADELLKNFNPVSGISYQYMSTNSWSTTLADTGTFSLAFKYLSYLTNDPKYWNAVTRISKIFAPKVLESGIIGDTVRTETGEISGTRKVGPGADSFYEYIAKQFIQTGKVENGFLPQWEAFMTQVRKKLSISSKNQFMFIDGGGGKTEHLDCFLGGTIALYAIQGARNGFSQNLTLKQLQDIDLAEELTRSCYELYHQTQTHLSPEVVHWNVFGGESSHLKHHQTPVDNDDIPRLYSEYTGTVSRLPLVNISTSGEFSISNGKYMHRPETLESLFYMYRITGKQQYRDMGWQIFLAYEKHLKMNDSGYAGLESVDDLESGKIDMMESFIFGETIKYLYLLFCDDSVIPLDKFVFNTEAHPLPIFRITTEFRKLVDWM